MATITKRETRKLNCPGCDHYNNGEGELYCLHKCQKQKAIEPLKQEPSGVCRVREIPVSVMNGTLAEKQIYPTLSFFLKECNVKDATMFLQYYLLSLTYDRIAFYHRMKRQAVEKRIKKVMKYLKFSVRI